MKFIPGLFKHRKAPAPAEGPKPTPKPLPPEAAARLEREAEEARLDAQRKRASAEAIEQAIRSVGVYWPGESTPTSRLSGSSRRGEILGRIFGAWR